MKAQSLVLTKVLLTAPVLHFPTGALAAMVLLMSYSAAATDEVGGASMLYSCDFRGEDGPVTVEFRTYREHFSEYQQGNEVLEATWLRHRSVIQLFDSFEDPQRWLLSLDTETMEALAFVDGQLKNATDCRSGAQAANHGETTSTATTPAHVPSTGTTRTCLFEGSPMEVRIYIGTVGGATAVLGDEEVDLTIAWTDNASLFLDADGQWLAMIDHDGTAATGRFYGEIARGICAFGATQ